MILQLTRLIVAVLATTVNMGNAYYNNRDSTIEGGVLNLKEHQGMKSSSTTVERRSLENIFFRRATRTASITVERMW
jgi:hypothetical protein